MSTHRAYCEDHGAYVPDSKWKTESEATANRKDHEHSNPGHTVQLEEWQAADIAQSDLTLLSDSFTSALKLLEQSHPALSTEQGACLVTLPNGEPKCYQLTQDQCKAINGAYIGGACR